MSDTRLMTYDEIAEACGISRESARQLVMRRRWRKEKGNDGRARVEVPIEKLPSGYTSDDTSSNPSDRTRRQVPDEADEEPIGTVAIEALTRVIERQEKELEEVRAALAQVREERNAARIQIAQIEGARDVVAAERDAARAAMVQVEADRDRWHAAATAPRGLAAIWAQLMRRRRE